MSAPVTLRLAVTSARAPVGPGNRAEAPTALGGERCLRWNDDRLDGVAHFFEERLSIGPGAEKGDPSTHDNAVVSEACSSASRHDAGQVVARKRQGPIVRSGCENERAGPGDYGFVVADQQDFLVVDSGS